MDVYHKFGLPVVVWGAVHPDITYGNNYKEIHRINGTMINQNEIATKFITGLRMQNKWRFSMTQRLPECLNRCSCKYLIENGGKILGSFGITSNQQDLYGSI